MSKKIWPVTSVESGKPLYDDETGKFLGWGVSVTFKGREFYYPFGVKIVGGPLRPIGANWCKVMYAFTPSRLRLYTEYRRMCDFQKRMCQFKERHFKNVEHIDPISVSNIKTVVYDTEQRKSRVEDGAVIQSMKDSDVIVRYVVVVRYPGNLTTRFIGTRGIFKKSSNVIDVSHENGNTVIIHAWNPRDYFEPEDSRHAAEMFQAYMLGRVKQNAGNPAK